MKKSWELSFYQTESLTSLFEAMLDEVTEGSSALVLPDGKPIHVRPMHPADIATLPAASLQCHQFFQLKDGEVAIGNDPYAGGTRLSDITLVMGASFETPGPTAEILLAVRLHFPPRVSLVNKLEEEGLRIPPMPLTHNGKLNKDVLMAMSGAPNAPAHLVERIESGFQQLETLRKRLKTCGRDTNSDFRKANLKKYFQDSHEIALSILHRMPLGETKIVGSLETGELLKLRLDLKDDKAIFDFSGTEPSKFMQLTDLATFGACFIALETALGQALPANAGVFSCVEVIAPARTWVNAKPPSATALGVSDGLAFISQTAVKAFAQLSPAHRTGEGAFGSCHVQFQFDDGRFLSDDTPGGTGAGAGKPGLDGWNIWLHGDHEKESVEAIEAELPLQIRSVVLRPSSGGRGKSPGGQGLIKTYQCHASADVTWILEQATAKPEGIEGGKQGLTAEISLQRAGSSDKEELAARGCVKLNSGDVIRVFTAGGGGYGPPPDTEEKSKD